MNSASKVGEIFAKAGQSYNSLGDKIMKLHPAAQELLILEQRMAKKEKEAKEAKEQQKKPEKSNIAAAVLPDVITATPT